MLADVLRMYNKGYQKDVTKQAVEEIKEKVYKKESKRKKEYVEQGLNTEERLEKVMDVLEGLEVDLNNYFVHIREKMAKFVKRKESFLNREDIDYLKRDFFEIRPSYILVKEEIVSNAALAELLEEYGRVKKKILEMHDKNEDTEKMLEEASVIISNNSWMRQGSFLKQLKEGYWDKNAFKELKEAVNAYKGVRTAKRTVKKQMMNIYGLLSSSLIKHYQQNQEYEIKNLKEKRVEKANELMKIIEKLVV